MITKAQFVSGIIDLSDKIADAAAGEPIVRKDVERLQDNTLLQMGDRYLKAGVSTPATEEAIDDALGYQGPTPREIWRMDMQAVTPNWQSLRAQTKADLEAPRLSPAAVIVEAGKFAESAFQRADASGDGLLSPDEANGVLALRAQKWIDESAFHAAFPRGRAPVVQEDATAGDAFIELKKRIEDGGLDVTTQRSFGATYAIESVRFYRVDDARVLVAEGSKDGKYRMQFVRAVNPAGHIVFNRLDAWKAAS